ncbi:unnamed protein product [Oppiella nova]|uniref:Uncharacterized protein n=1 Tax=Oppiella nova TaxID=334625 RepID=A0A7R9LG51_9ACAR|nr:unnamed protein product [Oppiella nova]CAG2163333.1 unnamed protein product [Oppiella nova]
MSTYRGKIKGIDCGPEANQWFETFLGRPGVRLLQHHHSFDFRDSNTYDRRNDDKDYPIIYHNKSNVHLINESSISDLNSRLPEGSDQTNVLEMNASLEWPIGAYIETTVRLFRRLFRLEFTVFEDPFN